MATRALTILGSQAIVEITGPVQRNIIAGADITQNWNTGDVDNRQIFIVRGGGKGHWNLKIYDKDNNVYAEDTGPLTEAAYAYLMLNGNPAALAQENGTGRPIVTVDELTFATGVIEIEIMGALSNLSPQLQMAQNAAMPFQQTLQGNGVYKLRIPFMVT